MSTKSQLWQQLIIHQKTISKNRIENWFEQTPDRAKQFSLEQAGWFCDFSKNFITENTLDLLIRYADACELHPKILALFAGEKINTSENRPALHTALRAHSESTINIDGVNITDLIQQQKERMANIVSQLHDQHWTGFSGKPITDVVNIGIGGSDLGPRLCVEALKPFANHTLNCHFIANIDPAELNQTLAKLDPDTTLFIVSSKSFSTQETLCNATAAKQWLLQATDGNHINKHFLAITANTAAAENFGIHPDHIFQMWDWVGGRYSLWSAIGLPIAIATSYTVFEQLLAGANALDQHFKQAPLRQNLPVILGLLGFWYGNFFGCQTTAVLPYSYNLRLLSDYLQQLTMESNGKSIGSHGKTLDYQTGPILWGGQGTNGQHAYHQLLHQGNIMVPCDFVVAAHSAYDTHAHQALVAHALAQAEALMCGRPLNHCIASLTEKGLSHSAAKKLAPQLVIAGNRPSTFMLTPQLTPEHLGALIALYEHKTFIQSVLWDINAFDQWGVELGKILSKPILTALEDNAMSTPTMDASTAQLIQKVLNTKNTFGKTA